MKLVIFCLLAVCAFKAVFADKLEDGINKLHKTSVDKINSILNPLLSSIEAEVDSANRKGINTGGDDGCLGSSNISIKTYVDPRFDELDKCRDKAIKDKNYQHAKKCSKDIVDGFTKEAKEAHATAKACIKNCAHTDCSED